MEIKKRLLLAQDAGPQYAELACVFEAAITKDMQRLSELRGHSSAAVRFASKVNPLTNIMLSDLNKDETIKFAAIYNPTTSTEILNHIGLKETSINSIIPKVIHLHKNASEEFQVFYALTNSEKNDDSYAESLGELYFQEAIYDQSDEHRLTKTNIDLIALESLLYIYLLGYLEAPSPTGEFWDYIDESEVENLNKNFTLFGMMPAIPESLYEECATIVGVRCLAGAWSKDIKLMQSLMWDKQALYTGVGGFYWQDSRSPRSSVASNSEATAEMLRQLFEEELSDKEGLGAWPLPVLWRLSCNGKTPQDVLERIVTLIETKTISDELAQLELLVGEQDDFPYGLMTNKTVQGELRKRVVKLLRDNKLDPEDFQPFTE